MIDASIYGMAGKIKSVADFDREALLADAARQQQQLTALQVLQGRQKADEYTRGVQRAEAFRQLAGTWGADTPDEQRIVDMKNKGFATEADALTQTLLKRKETEAKVKKEEEETRKLKLENDFSKLIKIAQVISAAKDQRSYAQGKAALAADGFDVSHVPEQFDPAFVATAGQQTMTAIQRVQEERAKLQDAEVARRNQATEKIAQGNLAVAQGNLGVARERLQLDKDAPKGVLDSERGLVVDPRSGEAKPVTVGGKPVGAKASAGQATESERTAGFLLQRIRDSQRQLAAATKESPSAAKPGVAQEVTRKLAGEAAANIVTGEDRQKVESAQLDILDAALTLGTGAAYTREQLEGYRKSYFPQIGDKPAAIKEKQDRLNNLIRAAEVKAGRAAADTGKPAAENDAVAEALKKYLK